MPSYLVETYVGRCAADQRAALEAGACSAAERLTRAGTPVRFEALIHIPEDETCFVVLHAPSLAAAALAARRAGFDAVRLVEAVTSGEEYH